MDVKQIEAELQKRQADETLNATHWIFKNDEKKELECYCRRSAFSELEMWLDQQLTHGQGSDLQIADVLEEISARISQFDQEAEKFYSWQSDSTADEYAWQANALRDLRQWIEQTS